MSNCIIGGIEGGATLSNIVLLDSLGNVLSTVRGPSTNHHLTGMKECQRRISEMVHQAKTEAKIPLEQPLQALGLSLSGCERDETNQKLVKGLRETYPDISENYTIGSDTEGSVATTSNLGGVTCIAGTGSNTLLINPDGTRVQCGGWGYLLGDEGSAWRIAHRSIKMCYEDIDNLQRAPFPIDRIWETVKEFFGVETQNDLLDTFYTDFDKAHIASVCKRIAELANEGDELSRLVFKEAGHSLAKSIEAVVAKAAPPLWERDGGIHILCVGSVWKSWNLLKSGFVGCLEANEGIKNMSLMQSTTCMAMGAAYMAADAAGLKLARDYSKNYTVFYRYSRES